MGATHVHVSRVQINRDPFARASLMRESAGFGECAWCGQRGRMFRYGWHADGIYTRLEFDRHLFCSIGCYRDFGGQ